MLRNLFRKALFKSASEGWVKEDLRHQSRGVPAPLLVELVAAVIKIHDHLQPGLLGCLSQTAQKKGVVGRAEASPQPKGLQEAAEVRILRQEEEAELVVRAVRKRKRRKRREARERRAFGRAFTPSFTLLSTVKSTELSQVFGEEQRGLHEAQLVSETRRTARGVVHRVAEHRRGEKHAAVGVERVENGPPQLFTAFLQQIIQEELLEGHEIPLWEEPHQHLSASELIRILKRALNIFKFIEFSSLLLIFSSLNHLIPLELFLSLLFHFSALDPSRQAVEQRLDRGRGPQHDDAAVHLLQAAVPEGRLEEFQRNSKKTQFKLTSN